MKKKNVISLKPPSTSKTTIQAKPPIAQTLLMVIGTVPQITSASTISIGKLKTSVIQLKPTPFPYQESIKVFKWWWVN